MRLVNTKAHALIDYLLGALLLLSPWLFDFPIWGVASLVTAVTGIFVATLSLITRFEFSLFKILPLKYHLRIDVLTGLFLAISPWMLDFSRQAFKPHLVFGLTHLVIAVITDRVLYQTFRQSVDREEQGGAKSTGTDKTKRNFYFWTL